MGELLVLPELKENDILVVTADIGNMPASKVRDYIDSVRKDVTSKVHEGTEVFVVTKNIELSFIPALKEHETLLVTVDVGNLPQNKGEEYLKSIEVQFEKVYPTKVQVVPKQVRVEIQHSEG